jgi:thioredoxin 1
VKILALLIICLASVALADDFKTIDGKEYKNVTVSRVEPDGIVLITSSGISKVYFVELPKEIQQRFHYEAATAAAYSAKQAAAQEAFQQQQEQLQRKLADENNKYWLGQEGHKKGDKPKPSVAPVADRGQQAEVIAHGGQVDMTKHLALGKVTVVDFYADWCGPCKQLSPSLDQMARTDPEIALRKVDIVDWKTAVVRQYNIRSIPQVNVYNRGGQLVGTVVGVNFEQVKRYVAQAKTRG